jgi:hypothetical protein
MYATRLGRATPTSSRCRSRHELLLERNQSATNSRRLTGDERWMLRFLQASVFDLLAQFVDDWGAFTPASQFPQFANDKG